MIHIPSKDNIVYSMSIHLVNAINWPRPHPRLSRTRYKHWFLAQCYKFLKE